MKIRQEAQRVSRTLLKRRRMSTEEDMGPKVLDAGCDVSALDMHSSQNLLSVGLMDGRARVYAFEDLGDRVKELLILESHKEACRAVAFDPQAHRIFTGSSDKSIRAFELEKGKEAWTIADAHKAAVNRLTFGGDKGLMASGDDNGVVKLWDCRQRKAVSTLTANEDYIADLVAHENLLFAASGDNTLAVYDLKQRKLLHRSMDQEDELLSLAVMKNGRKLVVGTQSGVLLLFSWDFWANCSDRFVGHPEMVGSMAKVDEQHVLTGSSDGLIRFCSIQPNKLRGVLGSHDDFPVEAMKFSHDHRVLASIAHDNIVRLWDMSVLEDDEEENQESDDGEDSDDDDDSDDHEDGRVTAEQGAARSEEVDDGDSHAGEEEDDDDSDDHDEDSDDSDEDGDRGDESSVEPEDSGKKGGCDKGEHTPQKELRCRGGASQVKPKAAEHDTLQRKGAGRKSVSERAAASTEERDGSRIDEASSEEEDGGNASRRKDPKPKRRKMGASKAEDFFSEL